MDCQPATFQDMMLSTASLSPASPPCCAICSVSPPPVAPPIDFRGIFDSLNSIHRPQVPPTYSQPESQVPLVLTGESEVYEVRWDSWQLPPASQKTLAPRAMWTSVKRAIIMSDHDGTWAGMARAPSSFLPSRRPADSQEARLTQALAVFDHSYYCHGRTKADGARDPGRARLH